MRVCPGSLRAREGRCQGCGRALRRTGGAGRALVVRLPPLDWHRRGGGNPNWLCALSVRRPRSPVPSGTAAEELEAAEFAAPGEVPGGVPCGVWESPWAGVEEGTAAITGLHGASVCEGRC